MSAIVGRTAEVGALGGFLTGTGEPRAVVIDGEPGIGKSTLLQALLGLARERGYTVLSCRPSRSERDLSHAGLVELLGGLDDALVDGLPPPQARVLRVILRREESSGTVDRLSLGVAAAAAVRVLANAGPVLLAVDDAQWLDHPTARTLAFVARRLGGTGVRVALVRGRDGWSARSRQGVDWPVELSRAMPLDTVHVGPVQPSDLSRILRRALGRVPAWPRLVRIAELAGGNPLYALELARAEGSGEDPAVPLPGSVGELARSRIARLPERVRAVLELAAVPRAPTLELLRRLDATVPGLPDALAAAARAGIVVPDGDRVRFAHPILAAAVYASIAPPRRRYLHGAMAMLCDDLEERARHLAATVDGPDAPAALAAEAAAEQAWRRGAPDAAADLLRLACRLTPPADADRATLRRIAYGRLLYSAGDSPGALAELGALVDTLPPGTLRARARYHLMYVTRLSGSPGRAVEHGVRAAEEAEGDASLRAEVYELLSRICDDDVPRKLDAARQGLRALERIAVPEPDLVFQVRAALVEAEFYAGLGIHLDRLEDVSPGTRARFPPVRTAWRGDDLVGRLLAYDGRIDEGLAVLRGMYERASVEGRAILPAILGWMAEAQLMAARFAAAEELTREAVERAQETGGTGTPWEIGFHAVALARLDRLGEAEADGARVLAMAAVDPAVGFDEAPARLALGLVAMARDRYPEAVAHLRVLDAAKRRAGIREPRLCAHAAELVEALVGAGELDDAAEALAGFEADAEASRGAWSLAAAARCRALLLGARGRTDPAIEAAQRSLSLFEGVPMPFERARTLLVLGQLHRRRRAKRLAREALAEALAAFEALDAPGWAARARAESTRVPGGRASAGLTATEETIARLAVEGLTNREIADRAFLSPKTVEVHLTRVYRKLGVRSRAGLAGHLAAAPRPPAPGERHPQA